VTVHPSVQGRATELRALADAVRRLIDVTVTHVAPAAETAAFAAEIEAITDRIAAYVPTPLPSRYIIIDTPDASDHDRMPYDVVVGRYSPLALPVEIELDPPRAIGRATFTTAYEGPPGCVHGAVIAGAFDMVLTAANQIARAAGPTATLSIKYRRPTLLNVPLQFEAEVVSVSGRRTKTTGRIVQDGLVTVEAEGLFIALPREEIARLRIRQ
jgi:acyl-coenzyme A thioesterase PaaI-like protein